MIINKSASFLLFNILLTISISGQEQPNVLMIISDDLNTRIGPYMEIDDHTPHLSRLAEEGIKFSRAYSQFPLCGPSRASIMSGLYPETNGVLTNQHVIGSFRGSNPELTDHPSMAGYFREQGYFTARVSKIFHMGVPGGIEQGAAGDDDPDSWDYSINVMGPETLSDGELELLSPGNLHYGGNFSRMILDDGKEITQTDYLATSQAIAILESRAGKIPENATNKVKLKPKEPFFLAVGLVRPHVPFIAPENCYESYPESEMKIPEVEIGEDVPELALNMRNGRIWKMEAHHKRKAIASYMASVRFMDQQVGRLMSALDRLQLRENTIVVFISDHGYNLGEHDCWSKVSLWEGSIRVPMIISYPGNKEIQGSTCESVTELIDLYPTLSELCGLSDQLPEILQGKSYARYIKEGEPMNINSAAYTVSYGGRAASIKNDKWRYTAWHNEEGNNEELYDHLTDPEELNNLAYNEDYQDDLNAMRELLKSYQNKARNH